jgi:hypothetical protein
MWHIRYVSASYLEHIRIDRVSNTYLIGFEEYQGNIDNN